MNFLRPLNLVIALITGFCLFSGSVAATEPCEALLTDHEMQTLAQEAAKLFQKGEDELRLEIVWRGNLARPNEPVLAQKLDKALQLLRAQPGDHLDYLPVMQELADILAGRVAVSTYSRREQLGYRELSSEAPTDSRSFEEVWSQFVQARGLSLIEGDLYVAKPSKIKFASQQISALLHNAVGDRQIIETQMSASFGLQMDFFSQLGHLGDEKSIYQLEGYIAKAPEGAGDKIVIQNVSQLSRSQEVRFYKDSATQKAIKPLRVKLKSLIRGRRTIMIPPRIAYKVEVKHGIQIKELSAAIKSIDVFNNKIEDVAGNTVHVHVELDGKRTRILLSPDPTDLNQWILRTAYFDDSMTF